MNRVSILIGVPGSGKSTYTNSLPGLLVCSADNFFIKDEVYQFEREKLGEAHQQCLKNYINAIQNPNGWENLVVDNTNLDISVISPYYAIAKAYNFPVTFVKFKYHIDECFARNIHGVPLKNIKNMAGQFDRLKLRQQWIYDLIEVDNFSTKEKQNGTT